MMRLESANTRSLVSTSNSGAVSMRAILGAGPKGEDGSNVLPTDTAISDAIENPASETAASLSASIDARVPAASTTTAGKAELATSAETITGTDAVRATTPAGVAAATVPRPAGGTTAGYVPTVQGDGSIAYAAIPGGGGTAVGAADL